MMTIIDEYYSNLYSNIQDKWVVLNQFPNKLSSKAVRVSELASEVERLATEPANLFHSLAFFDSQPETGRGSASQVSGIPAVFLDLDLNSGGRYAGKNPIASLDEIKQVLRDWGLPPASAVIFSGGGYHFEWWLDRPFRIESEADRSRIGALTRGFNVYAIGKGKERGWRLDNMGDLARIKRAVGSTNWKDDSKPVPVEVIELHAERRYELEELERIAKLAPQRISKPTLESFVLPAGKRPDFEAIRSGCPWVRHCIEDAASLGYTEWLMFLTIVSRCENGEALAHEFSKPHPSYSYPETTTKIREAEKLGPVTYDYIRNELGFGGLDGYRLPEIVKSPISLGYQERALIPLLEWWVYDISSDRYFHRETLAIRTEKAFRMEHLHTGLKNAPLALNGSKLATKVARTDFLPGEGRLATLNGELVLNVYRPPSLRPAASDCSTILGHFEVLFADEAERNYVLDYLAFCSQRPGAKIEHALFIYGVQGTGKSTIIRLMEQVLGPSNVISEGVEAIQRPFKDGWVNRQLMVFNELEGIRQREVNSLKEWISGEMVRVEGKGIASFEGRTPRAFVALSNYHDALELPHDDRRFFVVETVSEVPPKEHFDTLYSRLSDELPGFAQFLLDRDLSSFRPHGAPPRTSAKLETIKAAMSPLARVIDELMRDRRGPFAKDIVTAEDVIAAVAGYGWSYRLPTDRAIADVLRQFHAAPLGQHSVKGQRARLWAWVNQERWFTASAEDIAAHWAPPQNDNRRPFEPAGQVAAL